MENKVLNFLEWYQNAIHNINTEFKDIGLGLCIIRDFLNSLHNSANFYSQSFKPEMITELFLGINKINSRYSTGIFTIHCETPYRFIIYADGKVKFTSREPNTLNTFITICNLVKYPLNWKPEILNKYFTNGWAVKESEK